MAAGILVVERVERRAQHWDTSATEQVFGPVGLTALDAEGKALRDHQTMAPFTAESILRERMKDVIETGRKVEGPGIKDPVEKENGKTKLNVALPDFKSRAELGEYLVKELGIKNHTQEYRELYAEYGKELPAFK